MRQPMIRGRVTAPRRPLRERQRARRVCRLAPDRRPRDAPQSPPPPRRRQTRREDGLACFGTEGSQDTRYPTSRCSGRVVVLIGTPDDQRDPRRRDCAHAALRLWTSEASPRTLLSIPPHRNRHGGVPPIRCFGKGARKFIGSLFKLQISLSCSH
jgi:hypothetical protein